MSKETTTKTPESIDNVLTRVPEDISPDSDSVQLNVDVSEVEKYDAMAETVRAGVGHLRAMTNSLVAGNAMLAGDVLKDNDHVKTVESDHTFGGVAINVTTHREFQEPGGQVLHNFTQAQIETGAGSDVMDVLSELDMDNPKKTG